MTPNDFLKLILEQTNSSFTPPSKGWYLTSDLAKQWKCSNATANNYINKGIKLGIVDKKKFHVKIEGIVVRSLPHYFFKDEKKPKSKN
jgi:predicted transcriptional regulator